MYSKYTLHDVTNVFCFNYFKLFTDDDIFCIIKTNSLARIEVFINIEEAYIFARGYDVIICKFRY